jgi:hypothetical protein
VSRPRGCHRGVFLEILWLTYGSPAFRLHSYRRSTQRECFVARTRFFALVVTYVSSDSVRSRNVVTFFAQIFIEIRNSGDNLSARWTISGHFYNRPQSRRASARVFIYTRLLFLDTLDANSRS